jgi:4-hydroxy-2-oxoheptanedioate aldolase
MGIHPRQAANDERHAGALERVVRACRATGKIPGLACSSPEEARRRAGQGFQYLTAGSDVAFLLAGARAGLQALGR